MGPRGFAQDKGRFGRILIADDDPVCLKLVSTMVNTLGFAADTAITGDEAVRAVQRFDYFAVLMDCQMPVMDGYQATGLIRALSQPEKARVPIVGISAGDSEEDLKRCLAAGMNDYVAKPVKLPKLKLLLHNWLRHETSFESDGDLNPSPKLEAMGANGVLDERIYQDLVQLGRDTGTDIVGELIRTFVETAPACIEDVEHAVNVSDAFLLSRSAHRLRGSAFNLGAGNLGKVCLDIDGCARRGDFARAHDLVDRLRVAFMTVVSTLRERVGRDKKLRDVLSRSISDESN